MPDAINRFQVTKYLDGTSTTNIYGCCGIESATDKDGVITSYVYDDFSRLYTATRLGIATFYYYDSLSRAYAVYRQGTSGPSIFLSGTGYDAWSWPLYQTNALGFVTTNLYGVDANGQTITTNLYPNGAASIETRALDGTLLKITGTAVNPVRYTNGIANVRRVRTFAWGTNNVNTSNLVATVETSVDGLQTWSLAFGLTNRSQTAYASGGNRYQTNTAPDGAKVVSALQNGRLQTNYQPASPAI